MKKYIITYIAIFLVQIFIHASNGLSYGVILYYANDLGNPDGQKTIQTLLLGNILVVFFCLLAMLFLTLLRNNPVKHKCILLISAIIYSLFLPILRIESIGGVFANDDTLYISVIRSILMDR